MRAGATFAEVLEAALEATHETPASHQPDVRYIPSGYPFLFLNGQVAASRPPLTTHARVRASDAVSVPGQVRAASARASRQAPRHLSAREQRAFLDLVRHGAELGDDFTRADLQRAFRTLARRHHPDRHPGASASEQARCSATFVGITTSYRTLLARVAP